MTEPGGQGSARRGSAGGRAGASWPRWGQLLDRKLVGNSAALMCSQGANVLLPLLTVPYLTRILGLAAWGKLAFVQALAQWFGFVLEYGFSLSATREVARSRSDRQRLGSIVAGVCGARLLLAAAVTGCVALAGVAVPILREERSWILYLWVITISQGLHPLWFFQGIERMQSVVGADVALRLAGVCGIFLFVRRADESSTVLLLQACVTGASLVFALGLLYRAIPFRKPTLRSAAEALKLGLQIFVMRNTVNFYTVANTVLLGLLAPASSVGLFAGSEKIARAFVTLLSPVSQALYPRIGHTLQRSRAEAQEVARTVGILMVAGGVACSAFIFIAAPYLIRVVLGAAFVEAVPLLRLLSCLPTLVASSNLLGTLWLLPLGLDRQVRNIALWAAVLNIVLALALVPVGFHAGMAAVAVASEAFVAGAMMWTVWRRGLNPFVLSRR